MRSKTRRATRSDHSRQTRPPSSPVSFMLTGFSLVTGPDIPHPIHLHPLFILPFPLAPFPLSSASSHHRSSSASSTDLPSPSNPQPVKRVQRPLNPFQRRSHDCRRHHKRTQGRYKGSTRTTKKAKPIGPSLSPPHRRNAHRDERRHSLPTPETPSGAPERRRHSTEDDDRTPRRTSTPPPLIVPLPRSSRSTQKVRSRRILILLPSV
jgi:hypothetical protein